MKLSVREFDAMQMGWRKWYIEKVELKTFRKFGLVIRDADILEVGCGSGFAASLITAQGPRSYTGLDIMPEQLEIAWSSRACCRSVRWRWRTFFDEAHRVLKDGGSIYVADLSKQCIHIVDAILHWDHAEEALFTLKEFEEAANQRGFRTVRKASDLGLEGYFRFQKENHT